LCSSEAEIEDAESYPCHPVEWMPPGVSLIDGKIGIKDEAVAEMEGGC